MIVTATALILLGIVACTLGTKLFRMLLPLLGLVAGCMVGFIGFQGVFGTGAVSTTLAIIIALIVGLMLAILSFVFFDLAVIFLAVSVGATAFSYLGVALGLSQDGFLVFMLGLAGAILAGIYAVKYNVSVPLVVALTSLIGVAYILVGLMLVVGQVSLDDIAVTGVVPTLVRVVDQSFLWFFVWVGGSLITMQMQYRLLLADVLSNVYEYKDK